MRAVLATCFLLSACASGPSNLAANEALTPECVTAHPTIIRDYNYVVFFGQGSSELPERQKRVLRELAQRWKREGGYFLEADGYTDVPEAGLYSASLAQERANATKTFLVAQGVEAERIFTRSFGPSRQLVPTESSEPQNRRVQFIPLFHSAADDAEARLRRLDRLQCEMWVKDHCLISSRKERAGATACNNALDTAVGSI